VGLGAALLVVLHHFSARSEFSGGFLWQFRGFGLPAVNWTGTAWGETLGWPVVVVIVCGVALNFVAAWHAEPLLRRLLQPTAGLVRLSPG
jgi:hypothetical protein